jgi:DNA (cytosine-5)-methyltransferase 1
MEIIHDLEHKSLLFEDESYTADINPQKRNPLKVISLFSGAGGLDIGFENAGFSIGVALEADPACCETLKSNRPNLPIINAKIEDVVVDDILEKANLQPLEAALVIGGPPCQSFSIAGLRKGLDDDRGKLLFEFVRIVRGALPMGFVLENVKGLENWDSGHALKLLIEELSKPIKYKGQVYTYSIAEPQVLNAVDFGVPQHRERIVIVGNRKKMPFKYPQRSSDYIQTTVWTSIGKLPKPDAPSETAMRVSETIKGRREKHGY